MERGLREIAEEMKAAGLAETASPDALLLSVALLSGLRELTAELAAVAHGDESGPGGLEGVAVSVAGSGLRDSLTKSVRAHAAALQSLADAVAKSTGGSNV